MKQWSKERWRKLYLREALEQRLWPMMARGLRDYLIRLAEDDGALIRDSDDPVEDLLRVLGAHPGEAELVRAAVRLLRQDGFLGGSARSIFVRNLPTAQAWEPRESTPASESPVKPAPSSSSYERVRQFRERQRQGQPARAPAEPAGAVTSTATGNVTGAVTSPVTSPVTSVTGNVTSAVTGAVTSSRGSKNLKSSESFLDLQKDKETDLLPSSTRASAVTSTVTGPVTAVTSSVTSGVSVRLAQDEDDEDKLNFPRSPEESLESAIRSRAGTVREQPTLAAVTHPERWPEVTAVAKAFAQAAGLPEQRLGQYDRDPGVRALVDLYAAGFTQIELEHVANIVPKQPWWSASGKRLGLSSLSIEVVRRNLPGIGPPREASPTVAKVLANVRRRREAG